jgi:hypothetical protein
MDISSISRPFIRFIRRHHFTIFIVIAVGSIAVAVFAIYETIQSNNSTEGVSSPSSATTFNQATIKKLDSLDTTGSNTVFHLPTDKRANPFVE